MPSTLPPLHSLGLIPSFVCTADYLLCPALSHLGKQGPTYPSTPFVYGVLGCGLMALVQTFGNNAGDQTEVMIKGVLWQFVNFLGCGENRIQSSACR